MTTLETKTASFSIPKIFTVEETITVPPCTKLTVNGYLKTVKNFTVEYLALGKMRGLLGSQDMTAAEVHRYIDKRHVFVGELDNNSIWAYSTQHMIADFGVSTFISTTSSYLYDCVRN